MSKYAVMLDSSKRADFFKKKKKQSAGCMK
jgi:hypothetical protein